MITRYDRPAPQVDWWAWYRGYLQTPVWAEKRRLVFERARGTCEACGQAPAEQVHHLNYKHVGREPLFDLVAVCASCHADLTPSR